MFVFTAKFNKKLALTIIVALGVILCVIILIAGAGNKNESAETITHLYSSDLRSNSDRVSYLKSLGWEVSEEPIDEQIIVIPRDFTGVYDEYNELQQNQGFNLADYGGMEVTRYTYEVRNYPTGETGVVADIIVYGNTIIAGDIQSPALDGFMHGLEMP